MLQTDTGTRDDPRDAGDGGNVAAATGYLLDAPGLTPCRPPLCCCWLPARRDRFNAQPATALLLLLLLLLLRVSARPADVPEAARVICCV